MSNSIEIPTQNYLNWPVNCQLTSTTAFLNFLYNCLKNTTGGKIDMYTLFQMTNIPLIVSQKLISNAFKLKNFNNENQIKILMI